MTAFATDIARLDASAVIEAVQVLSGQLVLNRLLDALMRLVLEKASAHKAHLLLVRDDQLRLAAEGSVDQQNMDVRIRREHEVPATIVPASLLDRVRRCRERVILNDANALSRYFTADCPYTRPKSAVCLPIVKHAELIGILYLENNRATHTFTPDRLAVLDALASQAAISLENARLYAELQQKSSCRKKTELGLHAGAERYRAIDDNTPAIMHSIDRDGRLVSVSNLWLEALGYERAEVIGRRSVEFLTPESRKYAAEVVLPAFFRTGTCRDVPYQFVKKNGEVIDVLLSATADRDADGFIVRSVAILTDVTERKRAAETLSRVNQTLRTLYQCNSALVHATDERELLQSICQTLVEVGGLRLAWVGYREDDTEKTVRPVAMAGYGLDYVGRARISWADAERGRGPTGIAVRTGKLHWVRDIRTEPSYAPWRAGAMAQGYGSCVALPLIADGNVLGALNLYAAEPNAFNDGTIDQYTDLANNLTYGVKALRTREERRQAEAALRTSEERFRDYAETASDWFWETGPDHAFTFVSEPRSDLVSRPIPAIGKRRWDFAADVEDEPEKWHDHRTALDRHEPFRDFVYKVAYPDVSMHFRAISGKPVFDAEGRFAGYRGVARDVTEAIGADAALREREERLKLAIEAGRMGTWDFDVQRNIVHRSPRMALMLGLPAEQKRATYAEWIAQVHPDDRPAVESAFVAAFRGEADYRAEYRVNAVAEGERWLDSQGVILRDNTGQPVRVAGVVQDITARKQAEARQKLLLDEVNHRVKNSLLTVQSIAMQMARESSSPQQFYRAFRARLLALSHAHDLLTRGAWQGASLRDLLRQTLAPYTAGDERRIVIGGPELRLNPHAAVALAMGFHELATNAAKYGALSNSGGRVAIAWRADRAGGASAVEIRWIESGGPVVTPPTRRGFGSRLLERGLAHELDADLQLEFMPTGLECRIRLPLTHKVKQA